MLTTHRWRTVCLLLVLAVGAGIVRSTLKAGRTHPDLTAADRLIDEVGDETFPASDPPPSWTGAPSGLSSVR